MSRSYTELEKKIASKGVILPGPNATPQEVRATFQALGCPESPDAYPIPAPEDLGLPQGAELDADLVGRFRNTAWQYGASPQLVEALVRDYVGWEGDTVNKVVELRAAEATAAEKELRQKKGLGFSQFAKEADDAMAAVFGENFEKVTQYRLSDGRLLGNDPLFIEAFGDFAKQLGETGWVPGESGGASGGTLTPAEARAELDRLMANPEFVKQLTEAQNPLHKNAVEKRASLYQMIVGRQDMQAGATTSAPVTGGGFSRG